MLSSSIHAGFLNAYYEVYGKLCSQLGRHNKLFGHCEELKKIVNVETLGFWLPSQ